MSFIDEFEKHYDYDCNYMRKMADANSEAFETFVNFLPMGKVGKSLEKEVLWTAKIAAMLTEDCGACVQLNIKMALESGLSSEFVKSIVQKPAELEDRLKLIYDFAQAIALNKDNHFSLQQEVAKFFTIKELTELTLAIASTKIYPTVKRGLGEFKSCSFYNFSF